MSLVTIDLDDKTPPYEQIRRSVATAIAAGGLRAGHRLPPIRQLAGDLGVAPNTVARAYRELESDGFVRSRGRRGTEVVGLPDTSDLQARRHTELRAAVAAARADGLSGAAILDEVVAALSD